jgi:hypothetical protein
MPSVNEPEVGVEGRGRRRIAIANINPPGFEKDEDRNSTHARPIASRSQSVSQSVSPYLVTARMSLPSREFLSSGVWE